MEAKTVNFQRKLTGQEVCLEITGATLLDADEARSLPSEPIGIRRCGTWYWLRSPGEIDGAEKFVYSDGVVSSTGASMTHKFGIRPALEYHNAKMLELKVGEVLTQGKDAYYVIPGNKLLIKKCISSCSFVEDDIPTILNDYHTSLAKKTVDIWMAVKGFGLSPQDAPISGGLSVKTGTGEFVGFFDSSLNHTEYLRLKYTADNESGELYMSENGDISVKKDGKDYRYAYGEPLDDPIWTDILSREIASQLGLNQSDLQTALLVNAKLDHDAAVASMSV